MATHMITLEVDSTKLFDMLLQLQQDSPNGCNTDALGVRMAELLLTPNDVGVIEQVGLALYGVTLKNVGRMADAERIERLETELAAASALIHAMTPPLTEADIAAATAEAIAIRPLIEAEEARNARIERLEKALSRCNEAATEAGNDERHTAAERTVARGIGAIIRNEIAALAKPEKGRE